MSFVLDSAEIDVRGSCSGCWWYVFSNYDSAKFIKPIKQGTEVGWKAIADRIKWIHGKYPTILWCYT